MRLRTKFIILLNLNIPSILIVYLSLYHLDTVSDWLNGFGMLRIGIPKVDHFFEELLVTSFFNSSNLEFNTSEFLVEELNKSEAKFGWVASHEEDQPFSPPSSLELCTGLVISCAMSQEQTLISMKI